MQRSFPIGISFPRDVIKRIDNERGDVSRSRYLLSKIRMSYQEEEKGNDERVHLVVANSHETQMGRIKKSIADWPDSGCETLRSSESSRP